MYAMESLFGITALKTAGITVGIIALFTFLSVVIYLAQRRKERDTYYRFELRKKALEQGAPAESLMELQRQEDLIHQRRRRESQRLGGLITAGSGLGIMGIVFAKQDPGALSAGLLPLCIGLALFVYAQWMAPKGTDAGQHGDAGGDSGAPRA